MKTERGQGDVRIAMWSGPRNISTALMRSWGSRPDTFVCDEPFYAHYLSATAVEHPGRDEVLRTHESDWRKVVQWLTGPIPEGKAIFYQKHMAHHLLPGMDRAWMRRVRNVFLIRDPSAMLTSLIRVTPNIHLEDTGLPQQAELFESLRRETGAMPPVIDSQDVLRNPRALLEALCVALDVPFRSEMLAWKPGPRPTDGVWAKHWYAAVNESSGFQPFSPKTEAVPAHLSGLLGECRALYQHLHDHRLRG
jgi:Sulfotransferase domain